MSPTDTNRDAFLEASIQTLRREVPEELEWLFAGELPQLKWQDDTDTDPRLLKGWLTAADGRGSVEPSAEQKERAGLLSAQSRGEVALWLLRVWMANDTQETSEPSEARKAELREMAEKAAEMSRRFGRGGTDPEERYRQMLAQEGNAAPSSSLPHKGLLSLVAVCGAEVSDTLGKDIENYVGSWQGQRDEQCQALRSLQEHLS